MNRGKTIFAQIMEHLPDKTFAACVKRYHRERYVKHFSCMDQFLCMVFAQLAYRESLRDIQCCLGSHQDKLYHMGIRGKISKSTLADANELRNWRIWADFAQSLISEARDLYAHDDLSLYTILQILSVSLFEKKAILLALTPPDYTNEEDPLAKQLKLF